MDRIEVKENRNPCAARPREERKHWISKITGTSIVKTVAEDGGASVEADLHLIKHLTGLGETASVGRTWVWELKNIIVHFIGLRKNACWRTWVWQLQAWEVTLQHEMHLLEEELKECNVINRRYRRYRNNLLLSWKLKRKTQEKINKNAERTMYINFQ